MKTKNQMPSRDRKTNTTAQQTVLMVSLCTESKVNAFPSLSSQVRVLQRTLPSLSAYTQSYDEVPVPAGACYSLWEVLRGDWPLHRHKIYCGHAGQSEYTVTAKADIYIYINRSVFMFYHLFWNPKCCFAFTVHRQTWKRQTHPLPQQTHSQQGKL